MKICYSKQMYTLDEKSIKEYNIPGIVLMENAGICVVRELNNYYPKPEKALIVCGTGNNGGDGFVIARHLLNQGWKVTTAVCGEKEKIKGAALSNLSILQNITDEIYFMADKELNQLKAMMMECTVIVDALLGIGFKGRLEGFYKAVVDLINSSEKYVAAVDIPSGLDSDSGFYEEACIKADLTVTFQLLKLGLVINQGPECSGKLIVSDISIPKRLIEDMHLELNLIDEALIKEFLKIRNNNTHKGTYGRAFVAAGSKGMVGAALMSANAALRSGAGIVSLGLPNIIFDNITFLPPVELIIKGFEDNNTGSFVVDCIDELLEYSAAQDSVLIGPGVSNNSHMMGIIEQIVSRAAKKLVIDADGLNALSANMDILLNKKSDIILTPHPGEMARLMGCSTMEVQRSRIEMAKKLSAAYGVITVLKGYRTVVALPDGDIYINPTGNPGMATAGSGDVLAGIITGFLAQGMTAKEAAICGVYVHGKAGDLASQNIGEYGLTASDIIGGIPHTIKNITGK